MKISLEFWKNMDAYTILSRASQHSKFLNHLIHAAFHFSVFYIMYLQEMKCDLNDGKANSNSNEWSLISVFYCLWNSFVQWICITIYLIF